jgi:hypothetical protein
VKTTAAKLYEAYCNWCGNSGERAKSQRVFGEALSERGFINVRGNTGYIWEGIGLIETSEPCEGSLAKTPIGSSKNTFLKQGSQDEGGEDIQ